MRPKITALTAVVAVLFLLAVPPAGGAQQPRDVVRLGFISSSTTNLASPLLAALREGLRDLGYEEQKNLSIEYRFAESSDQLPAMAADLVKLRVAVILAGGSEGIQAAKNATTNIPIVMTNSGDAMREGFVASLRQPGGNITGLTQISPELAKKRVQILKELLPRSARVAILWNSLHPNTPLTFKETRTAAEQLGLRVRSLEVKHLKQFDGAFTMAANERVQAMIVLRDPLTVRHRALIAESTLKLRVPVIYETADYVHAGGFMFYGPDFADLYRRSATYVAKILKGAKPADLPVEQPTKFQLVINMKTAKALGLTIPPLLLLRADHVIE